MCRVNQDPDDMSGMLEVIEMKGLILYFIICSWSLAFVVHILYRRTVLFTLLAPSHSLTL